MNFENQMKKISELKLDINALYLACKDPKTPWYAKALAILVVSYALSPIDLIPDFIPILGYLDDIVILPIGIKLAIKLIPKEVMENSREKAKDIKNKSYVAGGIIIILWLFIIYKIVKALIN